MGRFDLACELKVPGRIVTLAIALMASANAFSSASVGLIVGSSAVVDICFHLLSSNKKTRFYAGLLASWDLFN